MLTGHDVEVGNRAVTSPALSEGRFLFISGVILFLLIGLLGQPSPSHRMVDFKALYYPGQVLIQHHDPYRQDSVLAAFKAAPDTILHPAGPGAINAVSFCVNFPTTLVFVLPLALLPWAVACPLWQFLTASVYLLAAWRIWRVGAVWSPRRTGLLLALLLPGSALLLEIGNLAGITVGFCILGAIGIIRERHVHFSILCLALSLLLKPQDSGLIWLCLLLAGLPYRRRALQTLAVAAVLSVIPAFWVTSVAPHWPQEIHSNFLANSLPGKINNPGPLTVKPEDGGPMIISLQTVTSLLVGSPRAYNGLAWLVCVPLLLACFLAILRKPEMPAKLWLALAAIAPLSMLPVYHRQYDTGLLMLAVPACALLRTRGGRIASAAAWLTGATALASSSILLYFLGVWTYHLRTSLTGTAAVIANIVLARPVPFAMLALGIFYICLIVRSSRSLLPDRIAAYASEAIRK